MYVISEYALCLLLVFVVATLLFAACSAAIIVGGGLTVLSRAAFRALDGARQQVRRVAALAVRQAGIIVDTMQR